MYVCLALGMHMVGCASTLLRLIGYILLQGALKPELIDLAWICLIQFISSIMMLSVSPDEFELPTGK